MPGQVRVGRDVLGHHRPRGAQALQQVGTERGHRSVHRQAGQGGQLAAVRPLRGNVEAAGLVVDFGVIGARDAQVLADQPGRRADDVVGRRQPPQFVGQVELESAPAFRHDARARLDRRGEHADDGARNIADRAVRKREVAQFGVAVAQQFERHVLAPDRDAVVHHPVDHGADRRPDFGPGFPGRAAERRRVLARTEDRPVEIVVQLDQVRAPPYRDRELRFEADVHLQPQGVGPGGWVAQAGARPVGLPQQGHGVAVTRQVIENMRSVQHG